MILNARKNKIRPIRSYVLRQGRLTKHQSEAIQNFGDELIIPLADELISWDSIFPLQKNEIILEIGFGMGDSTADIAFNLPHINFIGIEVHSPGVGNLINKIKELGISNLKIIQHDAVEVIEKMIEGRMKKFFSDVTLLGQDFVIDPDLTVEAAAQKAGVEIVGYIRMAVGEGIEKKEEDFAAEVAKAVQG